MADQTNDRGARQRLRSTNQATLACRTAGAIALTFVVAACAASSDSPPELHNCVVAYPPQPSRETPKVATPVTGFEYPSMALQAVTSAGGVVLEFSVDPQGRPYDIEVAVACPSGLFEHAALQGFAALTFDTPSSRALEDRHLQSIQFSIEDFYVPDAVVADCRARAAQEQQPVACYF